MKRNVRGTINAEAETVLTFLLCDKYMHSLEEQSVITTVNSSNVFNIELEVNNENECWIMSLGTKKFPLFVYEGDGDLAFVDALAYSEYPTLGLSVQSVNVENFSKLIDKYLKGETITSLEEHRALCHFFKIASSVKSGDKRMCNLDKGLVDA